MKSPLENINEVDEIIRQLQKMDSKMNAGQFIGAYRECNRLLAFFIKVKQGLLAAELAKKKNENGV